MNNKEYKMFDSRGLKYHTIELTPEIYDRLYYLAQQNGVVGIDAKPSVIDLLEAIANKEFKLVCE